MSQPVFFAVETGGTKIVWRVEDAAGAVLDQGRFATGAPEAAVEALIAAGEDVNARDDLKLTALHWAATADQPEVCELLLDLGADNLRLLKLRGEHSVTLVHDTQLLLTRTRLRQRFRTVRIPHISHSVTGVTDLLR